MRKDNLAQVLESVDQGLKNVDKLIHPVIWRRLTDLYQEVDDQIEADAMEAQD